MATVIFFLILAYLCGSVSGGVIVSKIAGIRDIREQGSGNPGATNMLRKGGKRLAAMVLIIDVLKGLFPLVLAKILLSNPLAIGWVGCAAVIGHLYPIFFQFRGGKGVAVFIGVLLGIDSLVGFIFIVLWLITAFIFRYSSLAALTSVALMPFIVWPLAGSGYFVPFLIIALFIFYRHRENIKRLMNKTEAKIKL